MIKSYSNKITKESFKSTKDEGKRLVDLKAREMIKSTKLIRTKSEQNSKLIASKKEKIKVITKDRMNKTTTKDFSSLKKEFKSVKEPIRIKSLKSAKNLRQEKQQERIKINPAPRKLKTEDLVNKKENLSLRDERQTSYRTLNTRFLSPKNLKNSGLPRCNSNDTKSFQSPENNLFKQYKVNDVRTIIEVKESKDIKRPELKGVKKNHTDRNILNITGRNEKSSIPNLKSNLHTNNTMTNIFSKLYYTAYDNAKKKKIANTKKPVEKFIKPKNKLNKNMLAYAFSNPPPRVHKSRPKSDVRKEPNITKKLENKPKSGLDKKIPALKRPQTSYKKYETEFKVNETSLSTQASSLFKGRVEDYAIGKEIGKGAYAIVKQALHKPTGRKMAIKIYEKSKLIDPQRKSSVKREIQILKKIDHSNIVKLHEVIETTKQILLVMELVNGVSLLAFLKSKENRRLEVQECKEVCYQIVNAIAHLHEKNIVHRDIKLENILIDENKKVKIIDFGFGCITANKKLDFFCGTPSYMPPEIVQKRDYIGEYADIWSLGILFFTLLCGAFPFRAQNEKELYSKIIRGYFIFPDHVPNSACIMIRKILHLTPSSRPSAEDIINDAWFNSVRADISKVYQSLDMASCTTVPKLLNEA